MKLTINVNITEEEKPLIEGHFDNNLGATTLEERAAQFLESLKKGWETRVKEKYAILSKKTAVEMTAELKAAELNPK